jgi:hypothetical protein
MIWVLVVLACNPNCVLGLQEPTVDLTGFASRQECMVALEAFNQGTAGAWHVQPNPRFRTYCEQLKSH